MTTPLTREAVKALRDDPARIALDGDDDAYLLPSGAENSLVAIPARDDHAGEYQMLNPEIWQQMVERFNAAPALATALLAAWDELDAVKDDLRHTSVEREQWETTCGEWKDRAEATAAKLAERDAENARLRDAAAWVLSAAETLTGYNRDLGVDLPDSTEIGRIYESRDTPSFRVSAGHIRRLAAALTGDKP